jgi:hypothetical protein
METHVHDFGQSKFKVVKMCQIGDCTELRIGTKRGGFRELTGEELLTAAARMMEDICIAQAMQIVHGKERGMQRAREVLGYA